MNTYHVVTDGGSSYEPFRELASAVILRAVADYRALGRRLQETGSLVEKKHIEETMKAISRFFLSEWYSILSGQENGAEVIELLDREVFGDDECM